ncbi:MAG: hypothetical protein PHF30_04760 [Bacilli bacterium]|nr:hypothetical protein [Bacilli bacterium]
MKIIDQLFILKNKLLKKDNIIMIIILSLILTTIFAGITIMNFVSIFRISMLNSNDGRTVLIDKPIDYKEMEKIKSIKHIELIENNKYAHGVEISAKQFDKSNAKGIVQLKPLLNDSNIKIIQGSNLKKSGDIICPVNFYPHSLYNIDDYNWEKKFYNSYKLDGKKLIGNIIKLEHNEKKYSFNIVGTFTNNILDELDVCYVSKNDFNPIIGDIEYCEDDTCYEYSSLMIRIDNYNNIDYVEKKLKDIGYFSIKYYTFDEKVLTSMTYIPLFICSIVLIISMTIIYNFFRKKSNNNQYQYGILKSVGYTNKDINILAKNEGILIHLASITVSLIIYFILYFIITNNSLHELNYNNFALPIPWLYILLFIIVSLLYIALIIRSFTKRYLNLCVQKLFER